VTTLAWVVGRGGLLGSHVELALRGREGWEMFNSAPFPWDNPEGLRQAMNRAAAAYENGLKDNGKGAGRGAVLWCAGSGVVGASAASLAAETEAFEYFLSRLRGLEVGRFFLASSAGGIWGGSSDRPITEDSPPRPISLYGVAQLDKEAALARWAAQSPGAATLVGRLSNLYGPGQDRTKPQGLVSHLTRSLLRGQPAHVFVPLDTIRDYLYVGDAAEAVVRATERLGDGARHLMKIFASEQATTVGELIGAFRRTARRPLKVVTGLHALARQHPRCLQFRSTVWREAVPRARTSLVEGIDRVFRHELALYQAGALPPPVLDGMRLPGHIISDLITTGATPSGLQAHAPRFEPPPPT
jgi:UDP-glucose 4-epimerase